MKRTLTGAVLPLIAATLLLALSPAAGAQVQRVLVISYTAPPLTVTEHVQDASDDNPHRSCTARYVVRLSTEPSSDVTVTMASGDTKVARVAPKTLTFTPSYWFRDDATVTVTCVNDNVANAGGERLVTITNTPSGGGFQTAKDVQLTVYNEDEEVAGLTVSNDGGDVDEGKTVATVNERGDRSPDPPPGREEDYTVKLTSQPTANVVVTVTSSDTKIATVSPASLTFTPTNYEKEQTVTVTGVDDRRSALDQEVTITHTPGGGDYGPAQTRTVKATVNNGGTTTAEARGLELSPVSVVVGEGQRATYTVRLTALPSSTVDVQLTRDSGEFISLSPSSLTFTRTNYAEPQTVTITGFDDKVDNDPASPDPGYSYREAPIEHRVHGGGTGYDGIESSLTVRLQDDDSAGLVLGRRTLRLLDTGQARTYTIRLKSRPTDDVTVTPSVSRGAPAATVSGALTFTSTNWNTAQTVTVTAENDKVDNPGPDRDVQITHTIAGDESDGSDGYARTGDDAPPAPVVMVTVIDTDTAGLDISRSSTSITEGSTPKTYTVRLESDAAVTVTIESSDPGVTVSSDPDPDCPTLSTTTAQLTFTSGGDGNWNEAQTVTICAPPDSPNEVVDGSRTVTITHTAVITGGTDQYAPDETLQVTLDDAETTPDIRLEFSSRTVYEADGRSESATYDVWLRSQPVDSNGDPKSLDVNVVSGDFRIVTVDQSLITYDGTDDADWKRRVPVTVTATSATREDNVDNGGDRLVLVEHTASGLKGAVMRVTVDDDDTAEVLIAIATGDKERGVEEGDEVVYRVNLRSSPPDTEQVTVRIASTDLALATFSPSVRTFTSANWAGEQTFTVTAHDDEVDNPGTTRPVNIIFTPSGGGYGPAKAKSRRVTVTDNDTAGLVLAEAELELEEGTTQPYEVSLKTPPTGTVTVTITSSNVAVAKVDTDPDTPGDQNTLTFRPNDVDVDAEDGDWDEVQTVEVTGASAATRGDRTATITHVPAGGGYGSGQSARITVKVTEDVSPGLRAPAQVEVAEGGTTSFSVELNSQPTEDVTVTVSNRSTGVIQTVAPGSLTFSPTNWDTAQQVAVTAANDTVVTGDRRATIMLASTGGDADYDYERDVDVTVTEDDAVLTPSARSVQVDEGGTGTFTVELQGRPSGTVTVVVASADATVATVSPAALTFTVSNYKKPQTVTVSGVNDSVDNAGGGRSTNITLTPKGGGYDSVQAVRVSVTVTDDEGFVFSKTAVTVREAGGIDSYTVRLGSAPSASVTVALASSDSRAATVSPAALTFTVSNYDAPQTVTVTGVDDDVDNSGDARSTTITHTPSGAGYSTVERVPVTVTDDDDPPSGIGLTVQPTAVDESAAATITVTATPAGTRFATAQTVTVMVGATGDSATEGTDYAAIDDFTLTIAAGAASGTRAFTLSPVDDQEFEGDETITVTGTASGAPVSGATITIKDDDTITVRLNGSATVAEGSAADFTVSLVEGAASADVVVTYTVGGTATPGVDYTAPSGSSTIVAGSETSTIRIPTTADDVLDRGETLVVELTGAATPSGVAAEIATPKQIITTIGDSDQIAVSIDSPTAVEGEPMVFTVTLSGTGMASTVSEPVTLRYATADDTATAGADYTAAVDAAVVVEAGDSQAQFTVATLQDDQAEPDETFTVTLSADPAQPLPDGVTLETTPATATIDDDDELMATLTGPETVQEGVAANFTVMLSQPLPEPVTVSYATADGSASAGTDYAAAGPDAAATIAVGETTATFMVATMGDTVAEANETFSVQLTALNRSAALATLKTALGPEAMVTIVDDDKLTVTVAGPGTVVEGSVATFAVTLTGGTGSAAVVVDYTTAGSTATRGKDYTQPSGKLTIAAGTRAGNVAIQTAEDKVVDPRETLVVRLTAAATTGTVAVGTPATVTTTIVDPVFESLKRVNQAVLPGVARASAASNFDALSRRMELAVPGAMAMGTADLAGLTNLYRALQANERALQDGSFDLAQVLGGSSFLMPLSSHDGMEGSEISFAIWGSGDYRYVSGGDPDAADVDWNGSAWSARLGADMRFIDSLLTGLMVSWTSSALDYEDDTGAAGMSGTHGSSLISVHPYVGWTTRDFGLWAAGGLGWGEVQIDDSVADPQSTALTQWSLGGGASVTLLATDAMIAGGTTALKLKAEGSLAHAEVEKSDTIDALGVDVNQARALVEASHAQHFPAGGTLTPSLEVGARFDGGDGETGAGLEVGGGLSYADSGVAVEARGRGLVLHGGNYGEWGLSGLLQYDPGTAGHGLMVSVRPTWGATASGVAGLWEHGTLDLLGGNDQAGGRIEAEIGYGLAVFGASGVLTPYAGALVTDVGANSLSVGGRLQIAPAFEVSLEALRSESADLEAAPDYGLTLEGVIRW